MNWLSNISGKRTNIYVLLFICLLVPTLLFAQGSRYNANENDTYQNGYIVKANYDTIQGSFYIAQPHYMEYSIDFTKESGNKSSIIRSNDILGFVTTNVYNKETYWVSTKHSVLEHPPEDSYAGKMTDAFLNVIARGPITIYYYYNYKEDAEVQRTSTLYMVLPDKKVVDASSMMMGFAKKMPKYVEDYPELAKKISKKEKGYKFMQIEKVAREYNKWYLDKYPDYKFFTVEPPKKSSVSIAEEIVFNGEPITFKDHPGVKFWLSEPYKRYNKWDTQKTGDARLSVALKIENKSGKTIAKIYPNIKSYDMDGNVIKQSSGGTSPELFEPNPGNTIPDGYVGVFDSFFNADLSMAGECAKVDFTLNELGYASASATSNPIFSSEWVEFEKYTGYKFRLSEPFIFVDDLSGNNTFGIALEFKNTSGKEVRFFHFQIKVYDDQGILFDEERQNHPHLFDPSIHFAKDNFPSDYQGINKKFYVNEESFIKVFKKIEFNLNSVEY